MWSERRERCGSGGKKMWEGVDLLGLRQTDSRQAVQSCADPSLSSTELKSARPAALSLSQRPPASARITQLQGRGRWAQETGNFFFCCCSPFGLSATSPPPPAGAPALRTWRRGVCCRYQPRSAQPASWRSSGLPPLWRSHLHGCTMATFVCRVQFLDDTDPFNSTNFPEPTRPPVYTFREDIPLINQIAGVHRLLKAPHKVGRPLVSR